MVCHVVFDGQKLGVVDDVDHREVYVARRQNLAVLFKIVRKLFDRGHSEVLIHAMGPCIPKALHVTQDVLLHYGQRVTFETRSAASSAKDILGDFDCEIQERRVSSLTLHLKMPENTAAVAQQSAGDSLLELVTKQVGQKSWRQPLTLELSMGSPRCCPNKGDKDRRASFTGSFAWRIHGRTPGLKVPSGKCCAGEPTVKKAGLGNF
eukprot:Skav233364  [mRNA]  locus=scaffold394:596643:597722:+ [translate_table: standard]